ncbi:hypothetical protein BCR44DRAFT_35724 [Catenaria anguillulae PL171]|uniref:NADH-ubiquinone reductase complex 1 MLRQ subunit-domain-containing protein n=1 Tax=Catenaria anguillulae PL171 TaxID=765915 RepID=A0A1Y2HZT7_9FUNG|nr:hypothetical protein BCR44DRAFT_35724 [Catenaria anguillulae PL171]
MSSSSMRSFLRTWYRPEVSPIIAVVGVALTGASYYVYRLSQHQEVVWSRDNPRPWEKIEQDMNTKFINTQADKLTRSYKREW